MTMIAAIQSQVMKPKIAPSDPYVASYDPKDATYQVKRPEVIRMTVIARTAPGVIQRNCAACLDGPKR